MRSAPNRFAALPRLPLAILAATVSLVIVGRLVVALQPPHVAIPESRRRAWPTRAATPRPSWTR